MIDQKYLIIGGNSTIGTYLYSHLTKNQQRVTITTRHHSKIKKNCLFLDLNFPDNFSTDFHDYVFLFAGITNMALCESNPIASYKINVNGTINIAKKLLAQGSRIIFLSSNTVFNGKIVNPNEEDDYSFSTEYGKQKALTEQQLLSLGSGITIVRISKLISFTNGRFKNIVDNLKNYQPCQLYDDLLFSPISSYYLCNALIKIAHAKIDGVLHLSGEKDISYANFAILIAKKLDKDTRLINPIPCQSVIYKPQFAGLSMKHTSLKLNIYPEPILQVLSHLN